MIGKPGSFLLSKGRGQNEGGLAETDETHSFISRNTNLVSFKRLSSEASFSSMQTYASLIFSLLQAFKYSPRFADAHCTVVVPFSSYVPSILFLSSVDLLPGL